MRRWRLIKGQDCLYKLIGRPEWDYLTALRQWIAAQLFDERHRRQSRVMLPPLCGISDCTSVGCNLLSGMHM